MKTIFFIEVTDTLGGEAYSSQALSDALHHPVVTNNDKQVISRYIHGAETQADRFRLQEIAIYIREYEKKGGK